jgi:hypothetical protein
MVVHRQGVPCKSGICQTAAALKSTLIDKGELIGEDDALQTGTVGKGILADAGDAVRNGYAF